MSMFPSGSTPYAEFQKEVGHFLGYSSDSNNWGAQESADVHRVITNGLRQFYMAHNWSFLRPIVTVTTTADVDFLDVSEGRQMILGALTGEHDGISRHITLVGNQRFREVKNTNPDRKGFPEIASIRPTRTTPPFMQQLYLIDLWPTPDAEYTLSYRYQVVHQEVDADNGWPFGSEIHFFTMLQSMLAVAERHLHDASGVQVAAYERALLDSKRLDGEVMRPDSFGYNGDRSEPSVFRGRTIQGLVTVQGTTPE